MASKPEAVQRYTAEVVPSSDLPMFDTALTVMDGYEMALDPIAKEARDLKITDKTSRERAGALIAAIKKLDNDGDDTMAPYSKIVNRVKEFIQTRKKRVANRVEEIRGTLTPKMAEWDRAEERAAAAERDRVAREKQAVLDREAEEKRREDEKAAKELRERRVAEIRADLKSGKITKRQSEKLLREAGAMEEALKAKAAADEEDAKKASQSVAEKVEVKPNVPTVAGNVRRVNWSAECTDVDGFLSEYVRCCVTAPEKAARMREMIEVSNKSLSAAARAHIKTWAGDDNPRHNLTKEQFEALYPCVKAVEDRSY
jgi:hypothetical protein